MQLDSILAAEYRRRSKDRSTAQTENIFQPAGAGGLGFRRLSSVIQDRKRAIIDRLQDSPPGVCRAVESMLSRARLHCPPAQTTGVPGIGLWASSVLAYALEGGVMARPARRREDVGDFSQLSEPIFSGILDLSSATTAVLRSQKRLVLGDLTHCSSSGERRWNRANHLLPELQTAITGRSPPPGQRDLAVGQVWQVFSQNAGELAADQMAIHEIREIYCDGLVKVRRWHVDPSAKPFPLEAGTCLSTPGPRHHDGDLLPVGVEYLFRNSVIRLVAISDPSYTPDGLHLQSKVL